MVVLKLVRQDQSKRPSFELAPRLSPSLCQSFTTLYLMGKFHDAAEVDFRVISLVGRIEIPERSCRRSSGKDSSLHSRSVRRLCNEQNYEQITPPYILPVNLWVKATPRAASYRVQFATYAPEMVIKHHTIN